MSASTMAIDVKVVSVAIAGVMFDLPETFFAHWCSPDADKDFQNGHSSIPRMPHIPGKPKKVHLETFERWFLEYHQVGGEGGQP